MLLIQQPDHFKHLRKDYKSSGSHLFTDMDAPHAMRRVLNEMLKDARPVYFIVDALDECEQGPYSTHIDFPFSLKQSEVASV